MRFTIVIFLCLFLCVINAQPLWDSRQIVDSLLVFKDWKNKNLYYYAPGELKLKVKEDGTPDFKLTQLRYFGTNLYGDKGEKRFRNIVQMTIIMERITIESIKELSKKLKLSSATKFSPLPITNLDTYLLASTGETSKRVGKGAVSESVKGASNLFWTERSFSMALDNYDAQLIEDQLKNNRLAFSFSYSFWAEFIPGKIGDLSIRGDSILVKNLDGLQDVPTVDTTLTDMVVKGDAFSIAIDLKNIPDAVRKIDINENSMPPTYAVLETRCYDFQDNRRSDLYFKTVEFEATTINGSKAKIEVKFAKKSPDINVQSVQFPFAVRLDKPLRYRVIETDANGERNALSWITLNEWKPMIDVTTDEEKLGVEERNIDFEFSPQLKISEVMMSLKYTFLGQVVIQSLNFKPQEEGYFKTITIRYQKGTLVQYQIVYIVENKTIRNYWKALTNDYVFLKPN
jgi:hypothetical protein